MLLLKGSLARGVLQLTHDLDGDALLLGHVELEGVAALSLGNDADANTHLVVEHEYPKARIQDKALLTPILQGSVAFVRHIDEAAGCMYALQHEVLAAQGIPVQGVGRQPYRS